MNVYEVKTDHGSTLFTSPEIAVQAVRLTFHKIAKVVPNVEMTQCTIVYDDKTLGDGKVYIESRLVYDNAEHL